MKPDDPDIKLTGTANANANGNHLRNGQAPQKKRVTFVLPDNLDHLLEFYCTGTGKLKNVAVIEALAEYLSRHRKLLDDAVEKTHHAMSTFIPPAATRRQRHR